ncbi:MAG: hypothetical protein IJX91_00845 [Clostridia bacterium]|nr:hypothetical protein [Clostridia bacterium]
MNKKTKLLTTLAFATGALATLGVGAAVNADDTALLASAQDTVAATVTVGEETTSYADFASALDYANTQESAKITLVAAEVEGVDDWIDTDLTLDLAGKSINQLSLSFDSDSSGSLVIEDSSGDNSGRLTSIPGLYFSTMLSGSVTINGGTFVGMGFSITEIAPAESSVTINGGVFEDGIDISTKTGTATINDGVFENANFWFYEGGEIFVKGGSYKDLYVATGEFADVLADGYALQNSAGEYEDIHSNSIFDGTWDSENQQYIYNDEYTVVEHTCEIGYQADETQHWMGCACFRGALTAEKGDHTGGTATCTEKAVCETCNEAYGEEPAGHTGGMATCTEKAVCETCNEAYGEEPTGHSLDDDGTCENCGDEIVFMVESDEGTVYYTEMPDLAKFKYATGKLLADVTVETEMSTGSAGEPILDLNGYTIRVSEEATISDALFKTSSGDSRLLIIDTSEDKTGAIDYDGVVFGGNGEIKVEQCIFPSGLRVAEGYTVAGLVAEGSCLGGTTVAEDATEVSDELTIGAHEYEVKYDETQHWTECDCGEETEKSAHTGGEATCKKKARCEECKQRYGELADHADEDSDGECDTCDEEMEVGGNTSSDTTSDGEETDGGCGGTATDAAAGLLGVLGLAVVAVIIRRRKTSS